MPVFDGPPRRAPERARGTRGGGRLVELCSTRGHGNVTPSTSQMWKYVYSDPTTNPEKV